MTGVFLCALAGPAQAASVNTETEFRRAWANPRAEVIRLTDDISLRACSLGDPIRESAHPMRVIGDGHYLRQTCFENRVLRQDGTGFLQLEGLLLKRGGSDGPGAAVTTRGEIKVVDSRISENLAEEPGGGIFSMRRATIIRSVMTGNLANDDGGAVYARRGGVLVRDSVLSGNLVDGSGGAIGSTGDIKVIRSLIDGNITDGDGGAIYTDEDGDVTLVDSSVSGNTADGPGGGIFTLDGDVTIVRSVLNGNRADDRGGAVSGESDVTLIDSTISRNVAEAHAAGGIWARGDLFVSGSTVSNNSAQGQGGGILGGGDVSVAYSSIVRNVAPDTANIAASATLKLFGSLIGPAGTDPSADEVNCRAAEVVSFGYNVTSDRSCRVTAAGDLQDHKPTVMGPLLENGGIGETHVPLPGSVAINRIPLSQCAFVPFGVRREGEQHLAGLNIDPIAPTTADQRGIVRPSGPGCDSGAVEVGSKLAPRKVGPVSALPRPATSTGETGPEEVPSAASTELPEASSSGLADTSARVPRAKNDLARIGGRLRSISRALRPMERSVARYRGWRKCLSEVPVSEFGADDRRLGFVYSHVDGSGSGFQSALAIDRRGRPDYRLLRFASRKGCVSARTVVGGTADPARTPVSTGATVSSMARLRTLEQKYESLEQRARVVERSAGRFDEWESCLSWLPVTEYGDPQRKFGFRRMNGKKNAGFGPAVKIDVSSWDDPDYTLLAFSGNDRPGRLSCDDEGDDGAAARAPVSRSLRDIEEPDDREDADSKEERQEDLKRDTGALAETVEDLIEPSFEFESFDQCMYTVGLTSYGNKRNGYVFRRGKKVQRRPALAIDMAGFDRAQFDILAFSGEEPPQIECNEDASGVNTEE